MDCHVEEELNKNSKAITWQSCGSAQNITFIPNGYKSRH